MLFSERVRFLPNCVLSSAEPLNYVPAQVLLSRAHVCGAPASVLAAQKDTREGFGTGAFVVRALGLQVSLRCFCAQSTQITRSHADF